MVFTASNGVRFSDKGDKSFFSGFIAGKDKNISIFIAEDLVLSFNDGRYEGSYQIPF